VVPVATPGVMWRVQGRDAQVRTAVANSVYQRMSGLGAIPCTRKVLISYSSNPALCRPSV
jgi:hypothetical protein